MLGKRKRGWLEDEPRHTSTAAAMADINLTPLIDVLLVLLIIFMVAVPVAQHTLDAAVPEKAAKPISPTPPPALPLLEVSADMFQLDHEVFATLDALEKGLATRLAGRRDPAVILKAAGSVDYGRVIEAMDAARGAGAVRIGVLPAEEAGTP